MAATFVAPALPRLRRAAAPRVTTVTRSAAAPRVTTATRSAAGPVRITRRGRLVILAVALLVVLLPGAWRAMATAQVEGPSTVAVTVAPGDTLWGIASQIDPGADPRALIAEIRELNGLAQSGLVPGQVLVVPAG
jgi:nucleoid-associated protein YgaU